MSLFKFLLVGISLFVISDVAAQSDSLPIYKKFPGLPPFEIVKVPDSTRFKKDDLKNKKATMFMVFSPDCDHCQHATRDLQEHMDLFRKVQIIMVSSMPYPVIRSFYNEYNIAKFPNIVMGLDAGYFFGTFFSVRNFPSIYLYDKKGRFVKAFEGSVPFSKIAESL